MTNPTDDQIRRAVAGMTSGADKARDAMLRRALAGDPTARPALLLWARRLGITGDARTCRSGA